MRRDVLVVGGGVAGPAAAVYLARSGLDTVVCDRGVSSIRQCAHLGNYLGFPQGIDVETFLELVHDHVRHAGAAFREASVTAVHPESDAADPGFRVETDETTIRADRVVAATKYDASYLEPILGDAITDEGLAADAVDDDGRTDVPGLYVAGPLGGALDQVQTAAGDGVRVARAIVLDHLEARGYWPAAAECYFDWRTRESDHGPGWDEEFAEWLRGTAPDDADPERVERVVSETIERERAASLAADEAGERTREAQLALLDALDDDVIREYLATDDEPDDGE